MESKALSGCFADIADITLCIFHTPHFHTPHFHNPHFPYSSFPHSVFSTLRTPHSALRIFTLLIFHTPHFLHSEFPHSSFSTLLIFHTLHFPYSSFPHSVFSTLRTPHSVLRTRTFSIQPMYTAWLLKFSDHVRDLVIV